MTQRAENPVESSVGRSGSSTGVGATDVEILQRAGTALLDRGWKLALAESCTGGLVSKLMTDLPGSSRYVSGGVVAYANSVKVGVLGVSMMALERWGAVSEEVAIAMAEGVAQALEADVGLAVTGIAGPDGASLGKPVGTVCFGLAHPEGSVSEVAHFQGAREVVRDSSARYALALLVREIGESA